MRQSSIIFWIFALLTGLLSACDPSTNRADLQRLLSPGALPYAKDAKQYLVASTDAAGQNNDRISIAPGAAATLMHVTGPGIITRIWFTLDSRDPNYLRKTVLRMYWDDEAEPSVNVPLGDFFGCAFAYKPYISQYLGMTSGGYICYFPMPFEKSARIEILNESAQPVHAFYYQINYFKLEGYLDRSVGYFHAAWNRDIRTTKDSNYVILKADGRGHVVGVNLQLQSYDGTLSYLEGNEMIYVDGEKKASIVGTGTEDYFSGGWYFNQGEFAGPFHGLILKDDQLGRISAYRLNINDPIPFKKHILVTIEHGHDNQVIADYSSTIYWYQLENHITLPPMPKASSRIVLTQPTPITMLEAEELPLDLHGVPSAVADVSDLGPDWSGGKLLVIATDSGSVIDMNLTRQFETEYTIDLYFSKGPDNGNVSILWNHQIIGSFEGYAPEITPGGKVTLKGISPVYGRIGIQLLVTGKSSASSGFSIGWDGADITPHRTFIPDWYILGPFPNPMATESERRGLDSVYPPEITINLNLRFAGAGEDPIRWKHVKTPVNGYLSLREHVTPNEQVVTYALTYIFSREEKDVLLMIGSDDGAKVFFNNKEVYRFLGIRVAEPDQAVIPVHLRMGWNKLLLKIENNLGGYAFYARVLDPENTLIFSAKQERSSR